MTEPVGTDASMQRRANAIERREPEASDSLATHPGAAHDGIFRREIEQLPVEVHELPSTPGNL